MALLDMQASIQRFILPPSRELRIGAIPIKFRSAAASAKFLTRTFTVNEMKR